jgi:hypothetical protein
MNVNEAVSLADRIAKILESNAQRNGNVYSLMLDIEQLERELRDYADRLDVAMYEELGHALERYDDALLASGV